MTVALPLAWTALVLGGVAFTYTLLRDITDGRRIDELDDQHDQFIRDVFFPLLERAAVLEDALAAAHARIDSLRVPEPDEPVTRPQPIVRPVPTDTRPQAAVIDAGLRKLSGATASGRHRAPR